MSYDHNKLRYVYDHVNEAVINSLSRSLRLFLGVINLKKFIFNILSAVNVLNNSTCSFLFLLQTSFSVRFEEMNLIYNITR